jgi:hypothetical protein
MTTLRPLSQRDPRWGDITLGTGKLKIKEAGCTITGLAILAGIDPLEANARLLAVGGYANTNLVIWAKIKEAIPQLEFMERGYVYNNTKVKKAIEDYGGCLVEVDGAKIGGDRHWVVYIGNGQLIDPWYGDIRSTSEYPAVGFAVIKVTETVGDPLTECLKSHSSLMSQLEEQGKKLEQETKELGTTRLMLEASDHEREQLFAKLEATKLTLGVWQKQAESAKKEIDTLAEENRTLAKEKAEYRSWYEQALERDYHKVTFAELIRELIVRITKS